jgi:hypothetical protein
MACECFACHPLAFGSHPDRIRFSLPCHSHLTHAHDMRFAACHSYMPSSLTCLHCMRRFWYAHSPRAGATRGVPGPGSESGTAATPAPHHPCTLLHTCPTPSPRAILAAFAPHRTLCPPSCTAHMHGSAAPYSHTVCPSRPEDNFRSIQGRSGAGRNSTSTGAHAFSDRRFHSVGMPVFDAAGSLAAHWYLFRTDFSGAPDRFRLGACSEARCACLHAIFPPQRMHATSPYQPISLSFRNG